MPIPLLAVGDIVQVIVAYEVDAQTCMNIFHYRVMSSITGATYMGQLNSIEEEVRNTDGNWVRVWAELATTDSKVIYVQVQRIGLTRSPYFRNVAPLPGTIAGPSAPSIVALSITRRGETAGRGKSGHIQVPGMPAAQMNNGYWSDVLVGNASGLAFAAFNDIVIPTGGSLRPVLIEAGGVTSSNYLLTTTVRRELRTMHRRTVGLGI